jgi:hypothetical protein
VLAFAGNGIASTDHRAIGVNRSLAARRWRRRPLRHAEPVDVLFDLLLEEQARAGMLHFISGRGRRAHVITHPSMIGSMAHRCTMARGAVAHRAATAASLRAGSLRASWAR